MVRLASAARSAGLGSARLHLSSGPPRGKGWGPGAGTPEAGPGAPRDCQARGGATSGRAEAATCLRSRRPGLGGGCCGSRSLSYLCRKTGHQRERHAKPPGHRVVHGRSGALTNPPRRAARGESSPVTEAPPQLRASFPRDQTPSRSCCSCRTDEPVVGSTGWRGARIENNGCDSTSKQNVQESFATAIVPLPASFNVITLRADDVSVTSSWWCQPHPCLRGNPGTQARKRPIMTQGDACHDAGRST